jgi:hypothetical protein
MSPPENDSSGSSRFTPLVLLEPPPRQPLPPLGTIERIQARYPIAERRKQQNIHDAKIEAFKSAHTDELARQDQYRGELKNAFEIGLSALKEQHQGMIESLCDKHTIRVTELQKEYAAAVNAKDKAIQSRDATIKAKDAEIAALQDRYDRLKQGIRDLNVQLDIAPTPKTNHGKRERELEHEPGNGTKRPKLHSYNGAARLSDAHRRIVPGSRTPGFLRGSSPPHFLAELGMDLPVMQTRFNRETSPRRMLSSSAGVLPAAPSSALVNVTAEFVSQLSSDRYSPAPDSPTFQSSPAPETPTPETPDA